MKISKLNIISVFGVLVLAMIVSSCGGNSSPKTSESTELKRSEVEKQVKEFVYPLPTSFEVTEMLNRIGASYILTLSNEPTNVDKYFTEKSKALNLGVYGADLSYASTYNQKQQTIDFMNASRRLIEELDIAEAVDVDLAEKIEANENNKEALIELITNSFNDTYQYLNENGRTGISMLVVSGSFIEGLYIACNISEDTFNNKEMVSIIMKQKESLDKLVVVLKEHAEDPNVKDVVADLNKLHAIYNSVVDGAISVEQLAAIKAEVNSIRGKIVQ